MATKTDIAEMATKSDIANMATKTDIADLESRMATKTDIAEIAATLRSEMATKTDLTNMAITLRSEMHTMGAEIVSTLSTAFDAKFVEQHQNMMTLYEQQNEKFTVLATEIGLMNKKLDTIIKKETQTDGVILSLDIRKVDRNELKSEVFI